MEVCREVSRSMDPVATQSAFDVRIQSTTGQRTSTLHVQELAIMQNPCIGCHSHVWEQCDMQLRKATLEGFLKTDAQ